MDFVTGAVGELLFLALAACYWYDIYHEAAKRVMAVERVEVDVWIPLAVKASRPAKLRTAPTKGPGG